MIKKKGPSNAREVQNVAQEIHAYLVHHPNAADTIDGIITWWLMKQRLMEAKSTVQDALNYLEHNNKICKLINQDGSVVYKYTTKETRNI